MGMLFFSFFAGMTLESVITVGLRTIGVFRTGLF